MPVFFWRGKLTRGVLPNWNNSLSTDRTTSTNPILNNPIAFSIDAKRSAGSSATEKRHLPEAISTIIHPMENTSTGSDHSRPENASCHALPSSSNSAIHSPIETSGALYRLLPMTYLRWMPTETASSRSMMRISGLLNTSYTVWSAVNPQKAAAPHTLSKKFPSSSTSRILIKVSSTSTIFSGFKSV